MIRIVTLAVAAILSPPTAIAMWLFMAARAVVQAVVKRRANRTPKALRLSKAEREAMDMRLSEHRFTVVNVGQTV